MASHTEDVARCVTGEEIAQSPAVVDGQGQQVMPPYKEGDVCSDTNPLDCYVDGCKYKGTSWGKLFKHVTNPKSSYGHGHSWKYLHGTYFHTMGTPELLKQRREKRKENKKQQVAKASSHADVPASGTASPNTETQPPPADPQFQWLPHTCWVKCDMAGNPLAPLEVSGICGEGDLSERKKDDNIVGVDTPPIANHSKQLATAASSSVDPAPGSMIAHQLQRMEQKLEHIQGYVQPDPKAWMKTIPHLVMKQKYELHQGPLAKGEGLCTKAIWPKELKTDCVQLPEFFDYMQVEMNKKETNLLEPYRCVGRTLGMFETAPGPQPPECPDVTDHKFLVGIWLSKMHVKMLSMPLMSPKYTWSMATLEGLTIYCDYNIKIMAEKKLQGAEGHWDEYTNALKLMIDQIKGGHWKRCQEQVIVSLNRKRREDSIKLKKFPTIEHRQAAVRKSFLIMKAIAKRWSGEESMPRANWGLMNTCAAGAIYNCTHGGRKMEWEVASLSDVRAVVQAQSNHLVCSHHKTWKSYGDLAKWIPRCLLEMFACYDSCPRPEGVEPFFVPAQSAAKRMSFVSALRTWSKKFMDPKFTWATVNDYRKFSHKVLMKLTEDAEKMKEVMVIIDAHGRRTQDKHYIMREPEEDAKLGEMLSKHVHGDPGPAWPSSAEFDAALSQPDDFANLLADIVGGAHSFDPIIDDSIVSDDEGDNAGDDEDMDWWDVGGAFFKVPRQDVLPLPAPDADAPVQDTPPLAMAVFEGPEPALKKQKLDPPSRHTLTQEEKEYYNQWLEFRVIGQARQRSTGPVKQWMRDQLKAWQIANGKGELAKPEDGPRWQRPV